MKTESIIWLLPAFPIVSFFLIVLITNRSKALSHTVAVGAAGLSFVGSMVVFWRALRLGGHELGEHPIRDSIAWFSAGETTFNIGVQIDPLGALALFFVAWTVLMIFIYSIGYHNFGQPEGDHDVRGMPPHGATVRDAGGHEHAVPSVEPNYSRFFAFISLFAFGMYLLVVSDNLLTLFVGWEIMGLCSYLLIGFWYAKDSARDAAVKAFMTTRVGDVFMLLGLVYLYAKAGTLSYSVIFQHEFLESLTGPDHISSMLGLSVAGLIGILLFIGTIGKSAQFPLHVWLPDAMEGPTPVSAMIHAATMVSAGVYMVIRIFPILSAGSHGHGELTAPMVAMAVIGAFTALFSATIAVAQNDIKRVLAYSTISQLGFMIAALGIGAYVAAAFHLMTHAFFKALLFLGSGSVIHGMEHGVLHTGDHEVDPQDMINMGGLRKKMPVTFWTFLIGGMALSGLPFVTAGFWSKDEIFADAWNLFANEGSFWGLFVLVLLALAALLTAFYTMRQITLTFLGNARTREAEHAHETTWTMTLPLVILSVFAVAVGWGGIPSNFPGLGGIIPNYVHDVAETLIPADLHIETVPFSPVPLLISLVVALGGLALGYQLYRGFATGATDPLRRLLGGLHRLLENKYYIDELYERAFVRTGVWASEILAFRWIDRGLIDNGILHNTARAAYAIGGVLRNRFELAIINTAGDVIAEGVRKFGENFRVVQTGKVQQYLILVLVNIVTFAALFFFILSNR